MGVVRRPSRKMLAPSPGGLPRAPALGAGHIALTKPLARRLREGSVWRVSSSLDTLFHLCNLGPGLFEGDRLYDKSATLAVTFASHMSNCRRSWASFDGLPGKCWHRSRRRVLAQKWACFPLGSAIVKDKLMHRSVWLIKVYSQTLTLLMRFGESKMASKTSIPASQREILAE
jgi:hypothetical protein